MMLRLTPLYCALVLSAILAACTPTVIHGCPPVPTWSEEDRDRLANEVEALPDGTMIERAVNEYGTMREASRLCRGG